MSRSPGFSPRTDSRDFPGRRPERDATPRRPSPGSTSRSTSRDGTSRDSFDGGRDRHDRSGRGIARDADEPDGREFRAARAARASEEPDGREARARARASRSTSRDGDRGRTGSAADPVQLRAGPLVRWIGSFELKRAVYVFLGAAVLGAIVTVVTGSEPGAVLGDLIVLGAVIAALGVERSRVHRLFPLPALTYLLLSVITGYIHDSSTDTSTTQFGLSFLQWIGSGFFAIFAATLLVGLILGARMLAARQLVSGSFTMSAPRPAAGRGGGTLLAPGGRPGASRDDRRVPKDDAWYEEPRADTRRAGRDSGDQRSSGRDRGAWTEGWSIGDRPKKKPAPAERDDESRTRVTPSERKPSSERKPPERKAPEPKPAGQPGFSPRDSRDSRDSRDDRSARDDRRPAFNPRPGFSPRDSGDGYSSGDGYNSRDR